MGAWAAVYGVHLQSMKQKVPSTFPRVQKAHAIHHSFPNSMSFQLLSSSCEHPTYRYSNPGRFQNLRGYTTGTLEPLRLSSPPALLSQWLELQTRMGRSMRLSA